MRAPGWPGVEPTWTTGAKTAVGAAISSSSPVWFTIAQGILTEVYFPRQDAAAVRDSQFLVCDADGGFFEEKKDLLHQFRYLEPNAPAFELVSEDPCGRFRIVKRVVTWDKAPVLLMSIRFETLRGAFGDYRLFWLLAPRLDNQGRGNDGQVAQLLGRPALQAVRHSKALCMTSSVAFRGASVGYAGVSDGWTTLRRGEFPQYEEAVDGHIALTAEIDLSQPEQTLAVGFGRKIAEARFAAAVAIRTPYPEIERRYVRNWKGYLQSLPGLVPEGHPHAAMQRISAMVIRIHQGKLFPGGITASQSIPWGESVGDENPGGYHLVWSRDMVEAALALLALGDAEGALDSLRYLWATQREDGSWPQNFWLDGQPYWNGSQLDETALPVHLAHALTASGVFDDPERGSQCAGAYPMVKRALGYLARRGPATDQDRWEENAGYSPFTLAVSISALILGADMARECGEPQVAEYAESLADYWNSKVEDWTFVEGDLAEGDLVEDAASGNGPALAGGRDLADVRGHYVRIRPVGGRETDGGRRALIPLKNHPEENWELHSRVLDGGFLQLVRSGLRRADDPRIRESVARYDAQLKTFTPSGPVWHRYNGDGYGERDDGGPYQGWGRGRGWPLLTGERGHYALSLGEDAAPYLKAMESMASEGGMIPEQVWDVADIPERGLFRGRPTGSAMPLVWAHAEYIKLLRSAIDGRVWEWNRIVASRYAKPREPDRSYWQFNHPSETWPHGARALRIAVEAPADLVFTRDDWKTVESVRLSDSGLGLYFADVALAGAADGPGTAGAGGFPGAGLGTVAAVEFTFYWIESKSWEGRNFRVVRGPGQSPGRRARVFSEAGDERCGTAQVLS